MYKLNDKIAGLKPYKPLLGDFSVRLDANESYLSLTKELKEKIVEEIKKIDFNRYPDPLAEKACTAFADYFNLDKNFVTAGNGSDELISVIVNGFFKRGEKVLVTSPDFSMYAFYCYLAEVEAVTLNKDFNKKITAKEIISVAKSNNVKGLILSNPCNPTSEYLSDDDIFLIIKSLPDTLIVLDEAYMDFYGKGIVQKAACFDNLIVLKTCSKSFGLAAIRLGFAIAGKTITNAIRAIKSPFNVNTLTVVAATVVLKDKEYLKQCTKKIIKQKNKLENMLKEIKGIKVVNSATNFVYIKTEKPKEIYEYLLKKKIAIRQLGDYLRINAGSDKELQTFIKAFKEAL